MNISPLIKELDVKPYKSGILNDLTFSVKDCIDIQDTISGFGNPTWAKTHPQALSNAVCVEQLLLEGATCLGKAIMDEFAYSLIGENHFYGTPLNPKQPDMVPGGSSSGSASSVASGIVDFSLGTDTGGSVRVPASNCGIFGFRPTHGRISVAGVIQLAPSLDTVGVLAKDFLTLKKVSSVLLGDDLTNNHQQYKVKIIEEVINDCNKDIVNCTLDYLNKNDIKYSFIKLSDSIKEDNLILKLKSMYALLHSCELWRIHGAWIESVKPELGPIAHYNFNNIAKVADRKLIGEITKLRQEFSDYLTNLLDGNTIFAFPTTPEHAPQKGVFSSFPEKRTSSTYSERLIGINAIAGLAKLPQITIPINDYNNIPIGISFVAGSNQDKILFNFLEKVL